MTLDKAIELIKQHRIPLKTAKDHDLFDALKLGIEAIEALQATRKGSAVPARVPLPGGTEE